MEDGEDGSELMGQLAALMEQLTNSGGMEGIPQELIEAQRADRRRQKENEDRRIAAAELAAANAPPERGLVGRCEAGDIVHAVYRRVAPVR